MDIAALRAQSVRSYEYQRKLGLPLPSLSMLQCTHNLKCKLGVMQEVIELMETTMKDLTKGERLCFIL